MSTLLSSINDLRIRASRSYGVIISVPSALPPVIDFLSEDARSQRRREKIPRTPRTLELRWTLP
jgi:hypothetical protein